MRILAISGSTRKESYNTSLLRHFADVFSRIDPSLEVKLITLNSIPIFSQDLEKEVPTEVNELISEVKNADGMLIATPEYGNMIPGVLKNTTEWLSRSFSKEAIRGKPLAIVGVSTGGFGTVRAQNQLLLLATILRMKVNFDLKLPVSNAREIFDDNGKLIDENVKEKVEKLASDFVSFIQES